MTDEVKPEGKNLVYLKRAGYVATAIVAIFTLGATIDGRYQTAEAADAQSVLRESGDIDTQVKLIIHEIAYLKNKKERDGDDEAREIMLRASLAVLLTRQVELRK